jgi:hypothetical protein
VITMDYWQNNLTLYTAPSGFHQRFYVVFNVLSNGYFAANPTGHFILVLRKSGDAVWGADGQIVSSNIRGQGVLFGNVSQAPNGCQVVPGTQLETLFKGLGTNPEGDLLLTPSTTPPPQMHDGVQYTVMLLSDISTDRKTQTLRYLLWAQGQEIYDSGYVNDPNTLFDASANDVWVGHVFDNPGTWTVNISNVTVAPI